MFALILVWIFRRSWESRLAWWQVNMVGKQQVKRFQVQLLSKTKHVEEPLHQTTWEVQKFLSRRPILKAHYFGTQWSARYLKWDSPEWYGSNGSRIQKWAMIVMLVDSLQWLLTGENSSIFQILASSLSNSLPIKTIIHFLKKPKWKP